MIDALPMHASHLSFPHFSTVNTYLFMVQAQGILLRDNVRTIGAQVYEQVVRSAYAKRNSSLNDSGELGKRALSSVCSQGRQGGLRNHLHKNVSKDGLVQMSSQLCSECAS